MEMTMVKKSMRARDLPPEWQNQGGYAPDDQVRIQVEPHDPELAAAGSLRELIDVIDEICGKVGDGDLRGGWRIVAKPATSPEGVICRGKRCVT
jgi:hypothetical protein